MCATGEGKASIMSQLKCRALLLPEDHLEDYMRVVQRHDDLKYKKIVLTLSGKDA